MADTSVFLHWPEGWTQEQVHKYEMELMQCAAAEMGLEDPSSFNVPASLEEARKKEQAAEGTKAALPGPALTEARPGLGSKRKRFRAT